MTKKNYKTYDQLSLSSIDREVLELWKREDPFEASLKWREGAPRFIFYEGPPSANGMPGIHHVMARTIKDIICRYKTMEGFLVDRKAGWDTHGLPVEIGVEKKLGITKADIGTKISVDEYNEACRKEVMKYTAEWRKLTSEMGYWVDLDHPYITYDNRYIETLWYLLKQLFEKDLLYKGYTIQPYSPAAGTGLSSHELSQPGAYRDVKDTSCTALMEIIDPAEELQGHGTAYFAAWTTTPWTLPSNMALAVGSGIDYVAVQTFNPYSLEPITVMLAEPRLSAYLSPEGEELPMETPEKGSKVMPYRIVARYKGSDLVGLRYKQLFTWVKPDEGALRVVAADFVTTEDGTGIVHIAPTFGADDNALGKKEQIPGMMLIDKGGKEVPMVDPEGKFYTLEDLDPHFLEERVDVAQYGVYAGRYVKNAYLDKPSDGDSLDIDLCMALKERGQVYRIEKFTHSYPHCWRTDKPILYYPLDSWFIRTTAVKERLIELNKTITWKPESTGTGRFGQWLENLQDWNLSRSRYWGTPLPIWHNEDYSELKCIGSVEELSREIDLSVEKGLMKSNPLADRGFVVGEYTNENYERIDLHRPYVDDLILCDSKGQPMVRETDLIDVWFDSGAMPYAQLHYPFEHREMVDERSNFPADFIAEGVDQTRGWFFTLHALATMLFDSVAYKHVISNGLVLDKNGNKMSKRLGNSVDPFMIMEQKGADALRWYMITNSSPWDNLKFDPSGVDEVTRKLFGTLHNTYSFFALYANIDNFDPATAREIPLEERPELDRWILSRLHSLITEVKSDLEDYEPTKAGREIAAMVTDQLSNWYVRLARKRFWGGGMTDDKLSAYETLYECLVTVAKLMAPFAPFYADRLYRDLTQDETQSVHLTDYPKADPSVINASLEEAMDYAQRISGMVLSLRRKMDTKVRQPLQKVVVLTSDPQMIESVKHVEELILSEVNVKELVFDSGSSDLVVKRVKPNFRLLGPIFGKDMKRAAAYLTNMSREEIEAFEKAGKTEYEGKEITLDSVEVISEDVPGWLVLNEGSITIALDEEITEELHIEGLAREMVNRIQNLRKSSGFDVEDKIDIRLEKTPMTEQILAAHKEYISTQVQARSIESVKGLSSGELLDLDEEVTLHAELTKVNK
ncbi:MAG: isoleucine--tRNA ligase [Porphyromonas sp.]|uniref:isoleucine--tRNA ligase n=1 Tax=Porphyromonas sp. TaxID=1924944 RepID=UPI002A913AD7|nr:isoleucine--tRNA ligase [Porphyromonas sp.]MDD7469159.1 isoleucine--tRNA ligase [Bacteroidales bacterium]MDY6101623.1 isoleucine--tRNA ligase [Porphyromonas sp.]